MLQESACLRSKIFFRVKQVLFAFLGSTLDLRSSTLEKSTLNSVKIWTHGCWMIITNATSVPCCLSPNAEDFKLSLLRFKKLFKKSLSLFFAGANRGQNFLSLPPKLWSKFGFCSAIVVLPEANRAKMRWSFLLADIWMASWGRFNWENWPCNHFYLPSLLFRPLSTWHFNQIQEVLLSVLMPCRLLIYECPFSDLPRSCFILTLTLMGILNIASPAEISEKCNNQPIFTNLS